MESTTALRLTKINAVCTRYYASSDVEEIRDSENRLVGLKESDMVILKGTVLGTDNSAFKVNFIIHRGTNIYDLYAMESTDSSIFVVPAIADTRERVLWNIYFMNAFLYEENSDVPMIRLLFRKGMTDRYQEMDNYLRSSPSFVVAEEPDDYTVMYSYGVPSEFKNDFMLFLDGKYSKMSDVFKAKITKFHALRKSHEIYGILYKTDARRRRVEEKIGQKLPQEAELYHCLKNSRETYHEYYRITDRDLGPDRKSFIATAREGREDVSSGETD